MSLAGTPSSFSPSPDKGGGEREVPARQNPQVLPRRERYLKGNEVTAGCTRGQTRQARPPSTRTRDGARSEAMAAITELHNFAEVLLLEAAGPGYHSRSQRRSRTRFSRELATTSVSRRRALCTQGSLIGSFVPRLVRTFGHIESTPNMAELRDSKYAENWTQ